MIVFWSSGKAAKQFTVVMDYLFISLINFNSYLQLSTPLIIVCYLLATIPGLFFWSFPPFIGLCLCYLFHCLFTHLLFDWLLSLSLLTYHFSLLTSELLFVIGISVSPSEYRVQIINKRKREWLTNDRYYTIYICFIIERNDRRLIYQ